MIGEVFIKGLKVKCIVGVGEEERKTKQKLRASVMLWVDISLCSKTDDLKDTLDYSLIRRKIINFIEKSNFHLLEALADGIADVCLLDKKVQKVKVIVEKPNRYKDTGSVGIEIEKVKE